jgi:hypothetical protein
VARIYRCAVKCTKNATLMVSTFHMEVVPETTFSDPDPNDVASGIWGHISAGFLENTANNVSVNELVIDEQVLPPAIGVQGSHTVNIAGNLVPTGSQLPDGVCAVINWRTETASRNSRGWMHPPSGIGSGELVDNNLSTAYHTLVGALAADMVGEVDFGSLFPARGTFGTFSRTRFKESLTPYFFPVTGYRVNTQSKYLRTRMTAP